MLREEVEEHVFRRGLDNDFIKRKAIVRAAESMDDNAFNISEVVMKVLSGICLTH